VRAAALSKRVILVVAVIGLLLASAGSAPDALADPELIAEFTVPSGPSSMGGITVGPDGNLWFTESPKAIGRITPQGQITEFPLDSPGTPSAIVSGADGNLWFTEVPGGIGRITPSGQASYFSLPGAGEPGGIAPGPDGNLWSVARSSIYRITPDGEITEFALPAGQLTSVRIPPQASARTIAAGPGGDLWFAALAVPGPGGEIGRITTDGQFTAYPLPSRTFGKSLFTGPDGGLWLMFSKGGWNKHGGFEGFSGVGQITPSGPLTDQFRRFPGYISPSDIATGPEGNLWTSGSHISRIAPMGPNSEFEAASGQETAGITAGPDGNLWFTSTRMGKHRAFGVIGRVPPGLLEVQPREWWPMHVGRGGWTAVALACVGGAPRSVCSGTLSLTTDVGTTRPGSPPKRTVLLGRRRYTLPVGEEEEFALHLFRKALRLRPMHRNLRNVRVVATANRGQDRSRLTTLRRPPLHRRIHRRHPQHRARR